MSINARIQSIFCEKNWPILIFTAAVALRMFYFAEMQSNPFFLYPQLDAEDYDKWALQIAGGDWLGGTTVFGKSPLYAYFLAVVYKLFGHSFNLIRLIQIAAGGATAVLTYRIGTRLFTKNVGLLAALMISCSGYLIFMSSEILKNSLAVFTTTYSLYLLLKAEEKEFWGYWLGSGLLLGLTVLNQPNLLFFAPLFCLRAFIVSFGKKRLFAAACFTAGVTLLLSASALRNYHVEKDLVLVSHNGGYNFYFGNNPVADGGIVTVSSIPLDVSQEIAVSREYPEKVLGRKLKASEASSFWYAEGYKFLRENPGKALQLLGHKFLLFWNWYEIPDNVDYYFEKRFSSLLTLPLVSYGFIAPLALFGLLLAGRQWRRHLFNYALILTFLASIIAFTVIGRYRLPILPLLAVYAAYAIVTVKEYCIAKNYRNTIISACCLSLLFFLTSREIIRYPLHHSQKILGNIYKSTGRFKEALIQYQPLLKVYPHSLDQELKLRYAYCLEETGETQQAIAVYQEAYATEVDPEKKEKIREIINDLVAN